MTAVHVNLHTYASTHVATGILRGMKQLIAGCGLDPTKIAGQWDVLERGVGTWLQSRDLKSLVLEVYDPTDRFDDRRGRFEFTIDYGYYANGDGDLWLDPDTVAFVIRKNGSYPSRCSYRIVADTSPGAPDVAGWGETTMRSTAGMTRHAVGTSTGGGSLGAELAYWRKS